MALKYDENGNLTECRIDDPMNLYTVKKSSMWNVLFPDKGWKAGGVPIPLVVPLDVPTDSASVDADVGGGFSFWDLLDFDF